MGCASETNIIIFGDISENLNSWRSTSVILCLWIINYCAGWSVVTRKVGIVTLHAGTNTVTGSYGRESKDQVYSPGHPHYTASVPGTIQPHYAAPVPGTIQPHYAAPVPGTIQPCTSPLYSTSTRHYTTLHIPIIQHQYQALYSPAYPHYTAQVPGTIQPCTSPLYSTSTRH
jgi:hypothetical protein